ncbi:hypothetical protein BIV57_00655 [Mangrovactinospora gilvigrisea]|uniref:Uncharacterized protein n=1 Tax=Mangrovactinospora gilvigrisea TaxID=1428644 RepID=A0A1J7CCW1_9ACTN|nr:hypothetical protein BIV57_00655 [Mangrovactinospora gilvigrisea]
MARTSMVTAVVYFVDAASSASDGVQTTGCGEAETDGLGAVDAATSEDGGFAGAGAVIPMTISAANAAPSPIPAFLYQRRPRQRSRRLRRGDRAGSWSKS